MSKMFLCASALLFVSVFCVSSVLEARSHRPVQLPNGLANACFNCHFGNGGPRNAFGIAVEAGFLSSPGASGDVEWQAALAHLDSDNDGFMNGEELQDINGEWRIGDAAPGNTALVSNPGDASERPGGNGAIFTLNLSGMDPHIGQLLELRLVDVETGMEVNRTFRPEVPGSSFKVALRGLLETRSYYADFYADLNGNGRYDAPPADHAWRIEINDVEGSVNENFTHNTAFTDIRWGEVLAVDTESELDGIVLRQNYPNPVRLLTTFEFELPHPAYVELELFDNTGRAIAGLFNGFAGAGVQSVQWKPAGLRPGAYLYRLRIGEKAIVRRLLLIE